MGHHGSYIMGHGSQLVTHCLLWFYWNVGSLKQRQGLWFSDAENLRKTQMESISIQMGYAKCRRGSWKLATFNAKHCQLSRKFIPLSVHLICLQHVYHDAAHRAGLSATADLCLPPSALEQNFGTHFLWARRPSCYLANLQSTERCSEHWPQPAAWPSAIFTHHHRRIVGVFLTVIILLIMKSSK